MEVLDRRARRRARTWNPRFLALCGVLAALTAAVILTAAVRLLGAASSPREAEENLPDYVERDLLTVNEWSRPGEALETVEGVVIHYVGNPGTSARANRNYFESLADGSGGVYASSHFIVGLEGEVVQCVPLTEIAYASNSRNGDTISIEVCHPDETGEYGPETYRRVTELTAWLCREFRLDPEKDVIRHYDVSGKLCPLYYVEHQEAWERLLADVEAELEALEAPEPEA
ncbi:MAG: N-acetylmuramoyl-L-alanine amidase [Oscillibacter sp.]|nr:N-acetylmuramoyl-L-alanine amidase [Oscillibacter sp.]